MNRVLFLAVTAMATCVVTSAHAGFEWVPPAKTEEPAPVFAQAMPSEPMAAPAPMQQSAAPSSDDMTATTGIVPMPPEQPVQEARPEPVRMASAPRELAPDPLMAAPARKAPTDQVEGFGRDIPLTIATRQIVPSDFTVQYGRGVDPNMAISWTGGRSWKVALADALAEKDLKATIVADSVMIEDTSPAQKLKAEPLATAPAMTNTMEPLQEVTVTQTTTTQTAMAPMPEQPMPAMPPVMVAPEPAPMAAAAPVPAMPQVWVAPQSSTLRQVLSDWCKESGVQLQWSAQYDYPLMSEAQISGSFEEAVETLLDGLVDAQPRPVARLHPNEPNGPAILVVETRQILE